MTSLEARRTGPIRGAAAISGDKSCSHRALILGAMADGETLVHGLSDCADVGMTIAALEAFGVLVARDGESCRIKGGSWISPNSPIDCGNSGTTARLMLGAVAGMTGVEATFTGDESLSRRPMRRLVDPLRRMGADIDGEDTLPRTVKGARLGGIDFRNVPASAQVKSALLLAGLSTAAPIRIAEPVPSRDHTEIMLREFGVDLLLEDEGIALGQKRGLRSGELTIGADPSSAAFPLVAAAILPGSDVWIEGMNLNALRTGLYEVLEEMGAGLGVDNERIVSGEIVGDVRVRHSPLSPCHVPAHRVPAMIDEIPALAVACAFANGESIIEGLDELRHKESDRLGAIVAGLTACGVVALVREDNLHIFGRESVRGGANIATEGDHRIAMAMLTLGLASEQPVSVDHAEMIATSFPGYETVMRGLGADLT
ncbi:3-phosphoshikimate 1-carboxyvinyltransferase [Sphingomonas sp. HDW15A]|uniref:3-phosphoshikimate 1-carboxyvinyltransferase n=1 Tax=Sphingomonas sp. HDW15A TaxID=2714942 RepID=UPI0014075C7D|nr:3-phosphoshikimate 1-carboxyvinyltransferase [Sphingomonas sp. HDW15A]QIK95100.1 3-phosphoshikimate 1-carboxyvinyltransferase [Sphingomonas sp. HDW15A]